MTALGFRVKSGFAVAVVLSGTSRAPRAVARRLVPLSDTDVPETKQPYHDGFFQTEESAAEIARRIKIVTRCATRSIAALVEECRSAKTGAGASSVVHAGLVVGSLIDPKTVGNPHIRAHAHEGQLFRRVLEEALTAHGVTSRVIVDKQLAATAQALLKKSSGDIARTLTAFGETLGKPWRAEEKAAATAAWIALK